jgi:uncharacterized protein involved in exopolysaccharide biosynthesis
MNTPLRQPQTPRDILALLWRHRWRLILPAFVAAALVLAVGLFLPRKYRGQAIFERRTDIILSEIINHGSAVNAQDPRQALVEELVGQPAIDSLRVALKARGESPSLERVLALDSQALAAEVTRRTNVTFDINSADLDRVRVDYVGDDPAAAQTIVNTLVQDFIERTRAGMEQRLRQTVHFLQGQVQDCRVAAEQAEGQRLAFEVAHAQMLPDDPSSVVAQLPQAQAALTTLRAQRDSVTARIQSLQEKLATAADEDRASANVCSKGPDVAHLEEKLRTLRAQLEQMIGPMQMTDKHPDVRAQRAQIAAAEAELHSAAMQDTTPGKRSPGPTRSEVELLLAAANSDLQAADRQLAQAQTHADSLQAEAVKVFPVRSDYMKLNRDVDEARRQLTLWEDNLHRVDMALAAENGKRGVQLTFLRPCPALVKPVSPNLTQLLAAAIGLALLAGAMMALYGYRTNNTCPHPEDLAAACGVPLYGSVARIVSRRQRALHLTQGLIFQPLAVVGMTVVLLILAAVLYLQLDRPAAFAQWRLQPARLLHLVSTADNPSTAEARE